MNELNKQHIDACRFCWMCRHICPIGNATGLERNTSRARALGLSLVNRGVYDITEVIDNVYECACCGACTKECVTGWDPVMFTKAARLDAALEGKLPEYIMTLVENCLDCGNAYGAKEIGAQLKDAVAAHGKKTDTLFFLGVDARYRAADIAAVAVGALEKANKSFTVLENELPSGQQLAYLLGAAQETKDMMAACAKQLNDYKTVVVYDPQDASVLKREYAEWGIELTAEIVTFTEYLSQLIKNGDLTPAKADRHAVYQDPFQLARDLAETQPAREVIGAYLNLDEMLCNGKDTMWAGNILMAEWMPEVIKSVSLGRIANARGVKANTIITASVSEYVALKNAPQSDVEIIAIEELI